MIFFMVKDDIFMINFNTTWPDTLTTRRHTDKDGHTHTHTLHTTHTHKGTDRDAHTNTDKHIQRDANTCTHRDTHTDTRVLPL